MYLKGPMPAAPPAEKIEEKKKEKHGGNRRIRCPHCSWQPTRHDLWSCRCGFHWHTFDTGGKCPSCSYQWKDTQCPKCYKWAAHIAWYEDGGGNRPN